VAKLYSYLVGTGSIRALERFTKEYLRINSREALRKIQAGDPSWEAMVPAEVARVIKERHLFGYRPGKDDAPEIEEGPPLPHPRAPIAEPN
jgi:hypothetical protein